MRRTKVQGAVSTNTVVLSLFISSAVSGTTSTVLAGAWKVTLAYMFGLNRPSGLLTAMRTFVRRVSGSMMSFMNSTVPRNVSPG